jgi:hypothetical protein
MTALDESDVIPGRGILKYMDPAQGDVRLSWEPGNAEDVATARRTFNDLRDRGYFAYKVTQPGRRGGEPQREQIRRFDPDAEQIVLTPPLRGG